jgi:enoyl-CoA hydratase
MKHGTVLYSGDDDVAVLRLNRPERMNAVVEEMYVDIQEALETACSSLEVRAIILTGSVRVRDGVEKQAFCAGADLKKHDAGERTREQRRSYIELAHETTRRIHLAGKPVIAAVNGPARGAGAEMAVACDFILMADDATIAFPETGLGTFVGGGVTYHLPRIVGLVRARELVYTGRVLDGTAAAGMGLALASFPVGELMEQALALARLLASKAPASLALAKAHLQRSGTSSLDEALRLEAEAILGLMETEDWKEGIRAFTEGRRPVYRGR